MPWKVKNPDSLMVQQAAALYNFTRAPEFPAPSGPWGIDDGVWNALIALTKAKCRALRIPTPPGNDLKGMCIWGSVIAAKFYVIKFGHIDSRVIRVEAASDHYFVTVKANTQTWICDITCNQFGGPSFIAGSLKDVKGPAQKVKVGNLGLYDAYALGAQSSTFVI